MFGKKEAPRGERVTKASGWRLLATTGKLRFWVGTLISKVDIGDDTILIFKVRNKNK
jgi:hypothetical protein